MEKVTFISFNNRAYLLQVKPERKYFRGEVLEVMPAKLIEFAGGRYSTDDPEEIKLIRDSKAFRKGRVREAGRSEEGITGTPKKHTEEIKQKEQSTVRGMITADRLHAEAGLNVKPEGMARLAEKSTKCDFPGCGKIFEDDPHGKKLRMHQMSHRKVEEAKAIIKERTEGVLKEE